jgi:type IV secretory pathway TraG/TraD family ATPase VirD4
LTDKQKKNEKIFDKMFGKKKSSGTSGQVSSSAGSASAKTGGKVMYNQKGEKVIITASEGTVEYWNQIRECLGMSKLRE